MPRGKISTFAAFGGHLGFERQMKSENILKIVRDRAILSEFFTPQGSTRVSYSKEKKFNFHHLWWRSWILAENEKL